NLKTSSYRDVLASASVSALAATRDPGVVSKLKAAALAPSPFGARAAALRALADYASHDPSLVPWMCQRISDPDERLTLAVVAAGPAGDARASPTLERGARKGGNPRARAYGEEALTRVKAGEKKAPLKYPPPGRVPHPPTRPGASRPPPRKRKEAQGRALEPL